MRINVVITTSLFPHFIGVRVIHVDQLLIYPLGAPCCEVSLDLTILHSTPHLCYIGSCFIRYLYLFT